MCLKCRDAGDHRRRRLRGTPGLNPNAVCGVPLAETEMKVHDELLSLGFKAAGTIHPIDLNRCAYVIDPDVTGFVVYAHVVGDQIKKFGTTRPSLKSRVSQNA